MDIDSGTSTGYGSQTACLEAAGYFCLPTTVALFSVLLVLALLTLADAYSVFWEFGASSHGSFGRLAGLDTSLGSGFLMHGPFLRYCPVAWEFFLCSPLLLLLVPGVLLWILTLSFFNRLS